MGGESRAQRGLGNRRRFGVHRTMDVDTRALAGLVAEASRGRMLACLMDGRARTAKELAFAAEVTAPTASSHLAKLVKGEVLAVEVQGRHRYFRIARREIAGALEALMAAAGVAPGSGGAMTEPAKLPPIKLARFCYDHLAGWVGVELLSGLQRQRVLTAQGKDFAITRRGESWLEERGVEVEQVRGERRRLACACLDWSERRPHLGGALGKAIAERWLAEKWIRRREDSRAISVTEKGRREIPAKFGVALPG